MSGGMISHIQSELEISCLPKDIPENITVDISELEIGIVYIYLKSRCRLMLYWQRQLTMNMIHL